MTAYINQHQRTIGVAAANSQEYLEAVFAALNKGEIVVTLRSSGDLDRISISGAEQIITPGNTSGWIELPEYSANSNENIAQLLFTSGTEGKPKGILLTHSALANTTDRLIDVMEIDGSIREYLGVPVFYSFGFGRARVLSQVNGACYLPPNGFDPLELAELLQQNQVNSLSAVPTLLRVALKNRELFEDCGKNLRWLEIGSQYMSKQEKEELKTLFPEAKIIQHYGLTEASRTTFLKIHENSGLALESVGMCYGGPEYRIGDDDRIQIRGPHVAKQMLKDGELVSLLDEDGWLTTSDLGYSDGEFLYYDGRADDMINIGGIKISPESLQQQLAQKLNAQNSIGITRIPDELRGDGILIGYLNNASFSGEQLKAEANQLLRESGIELGNALTCFGVDKLPVTETGKLQRNSLAEQYQQALKTQPSETFSTPDLSSVKGMGTQTPLQQKIVEIWQEVLNVSPVSIQDSFFDLGGDSLSAIRLTIKMEKAGIPKATCQEIFRGKSIAQLVEHSTQNTALPEKRTTVSSASKAIDIVRGVLVLLVIASHWMPGIMQHMSESVNALNRYLAPLYSAGTPGFAIIFGVSVGFFNLSLYRNHPNSILPLIKTNALILFVGIFCMGLIRNLSGVSQGEEMSGVDVANQFWSVLVFYLLAVLSLPLWLRALTRFNNFTLSCLALATIFYAAHILLDDILKITPSDNPIVQFIILIGTAKYNYFEMAAGTLLGVSVGNWYRTAISENISLKPAFYLGLILAGFSILLSHELGQSAMWLQWPKGLYLWSWCFYLGLVMILINVLYEIIHKDVIPFSIEFVFNLLAIAGILAFPLFIGHELVRPLRDLFASLNLPLALPAALLLFLLPTCYGFTKFYGLYFKKHTSQQLNAQLVEQVSK